MAAPGVSGAIAAVLDHYIGTADWLFNWPETVKALVLAHATDVGGDTTQYGRGLVDAYRMSFFQPGINGQSNFWGNTVANSGDALDFEFQVPAGYNQVRVALTWSDPAGANDAVNDLDLYVYAGACGAGPLAGASASFDDTVEFANVAANPARPGGTWCARVRGLSLSSAQPFGLVTYPIITPASLSVSSTLSPDTIQPGASFYLYSTVANAGITAGGSYIRMRPPAGFVVNGARIYTQDGREHYYPIADLFDAGDGHYRVATGSVIGGAPRVVRWFITAPPGIARGRHAFNTVAFYSNAGALTASTNESNASLLIPFNIFTPLLLVQ
jgi:hypothetical protein